MAVFSPTNAKVHFKAYDGSFADSLSNTGIVQNHGVTMDATQTLFGQTSMYMADFKDSITFSDATVFDVGNGDYSVGFWFYPTQFTSPGIVCLLQMIMKMDESFKNILS
jgi:hypothetical protein